MTDILSFSKKAFTWSVVSLTALASLAVAAIVAPSAAQSATQAPNAQPGDWIKSTGASSVFMVDNDFERVPYTFGWVFKQYHGDIGQYSGEIMEISPSDMDLYQSEDSGEMVHPLPGTLVKTQVSSKVYVVLPDGSRAPIANEAAAQKWFGNNWNQTVSEGGDIMDYPDIFLSQLDRNSEEITEDTLPGGLLIKTSGSDTVYYSMDGKLHEVEGSLPSHADVEVYSSSQLSGLEMSSQTKTAASIFDPLSYVDQDMDQDNGDDQNGDDNGDDQNGEVEGSLDVSLSANTPESQTVPQDATHVEYLRFNVEAGDENVTVQDITAQRFGLGDDSDFGDVWLEANGSPVTGGKSLSSDDSVILNPNYTVGAGETVEFSLVADMSSANTSHQNGFRITSADMFETEGNIEVSGDFPVSGNKMDYSSYSIGTATLDHRGSATEVEAGDEQEIVGEFEVDYSSTQSESDAELVYAKFKQEGNADMEELSNIALYEDGSMLQGDVTVSGDYVTFMPEDMTIEDGETRRFSIRADVGNIDNGDTVEFDLDDTRDLFVKENDTGFGSSITDTMSCGSGSDSMCTYTVDAGQFTVSLDSTSPGSEDYAKGTQDIAALVGKADLGQDVSVDGLDIWFHTDSDESASSGSDESANINADIERAELLVNGKKITGLTSVSESSATDDNDISSDEYYYSFDSSFELSDDDKIQLRLDLEDDAVSNTYKFTFDSGDFDDPEYMSDGDDVPNGNLSGTVTGNQVNIVNASLTLTRNDGNQTNESFIIGSGEKELMGTLLKSGDSSDITVQTLNFDFSNLADASTTYFTNFKVMIDGTQVGDSEDMKYSSGGTMTFDNLNYTLEKNGSAEVKLMGAVQKGLADGTTSTITIDESDSLIEDEEGDEISGWGDVTSATGLTFKENAALTVQLDSNTADSGLAVANSSADVATYRFSADDGDVDIDELYFGIVTSSPKTATTISKLDDLVNRFQLVVDGTVVDSDAPSNGKVHFTLGSGNEVMVEKDKVNRVKVRAVFNDLTDQRDLDERDLNLSLYALEGETKGSGTDLTASDINSGNDNIQVSDSLDLTALQNMASNRMVVVRTAPTLNTVDLNNTLNDGTKDIYSFRVSASDNYDMSWNQVSLELSGTCNKGNTKLVDCVSTSSLELTEKDENTDLVSSVSVGNSSTNSVRYKIELSGVETISGAASKTYEVTTNLSNFSGDNDSLTVNIEDNESNPDVRGNTQAKSFSDTFVWTDNSAGYEATADTQWLQGWNVEGLDTSSFSLSR